ncbi:hypothetical protein OROMI_004794 [Orobanche minor]
MFGKDLYASGDSIRRRGIRSLSHDLKFERQVSSIGSYCSYSSSDIDEIKNLWIEYVFEHHQQ